MKIIPFQDIYSFDWNECCENSSQAWLYHTAEWISLEKKYFAASNFSFAVLDKGRIVAIQPFYLSELGLGTWVERLVHSGIHRHTGLAVINSINKGDLKAIRKIVMSRIFSVANESNADRIQLNVQNLSPESQSLQRQEIPFWIDGYGFFLGLRFGPSGISPAPGMSSCCADQIVTLSPSEDELFDSLDESCRRAIRKGTAAGLQFEAVTNTALQSVDSYYNLAKLSAKRTGETLATRSYFNDLLESLAPIGRVAVIFALHQGKRVAAVMIGIAKGAASYLGGVSHADYLPMRVNDFLHWAAIRWAKRIGIKFYRLGPTFPEAPLAWPIHRVSRFKSKFGSRSLTIIQGSCFLHPEKYIVNSAKCAAMIYSKSLSGKIAADDSY